MGERITGLIRYFVGLVSPSYVPETPLPQDPGKSASLPLAEALSIVEPGATATITRETTLIFQRFSMALQRGNAVCFHDTMATE